MDAAVAVAAPKAHLLLLAITLAPTVVHVPYTVSIILHAIVTIYVAAWRSVKPEAPVETMTTRDAARFPLVGSAVLLSLFLLFKFLPRALVNAVLTLYLAAMGVVALAYVAEPFVRAALPAALRNAQVTLPVSRLPRIPGLLPAPEDLVLSGPQAGAAAGAAGLCAWYYGSRHWLGNNLLGLAFSLAAVDQMSLGSVKTAGLLLGLLFFYDIFWVFFTPVMVEVAKNFDAPIKLLFRRVPAIAGAPAQFSMLGLGDIVLPGLFVALILRYDASRHFRSSYFQSAFWGYAAGLATCIFVMIAFEAAQPALLYIVPAVLGAVALHAAAAGELRHLLAYSEGGAQEREPAGEGKKDE